MVKYLIRNSFVTLTVLFSLSIYAQEIEITQLESGAAFGGGISGTVNTGSSILGIYTTQLGTTYLKVLDTKTFESKITESCKEGFHLPGQKKGSKHAIGIEVIEVNKRYFAVAKYYNKKTKSFELHLQEADNKGNTIGEMKRVASTPVKYLIEGPGTYFLSVSQDKSRLIIHHDTWQVKREKGIEQKIISFNGDFSEIKEEEFTLKASSTNFYPNERLLALGNGSVILTGWYASKDHKGSQFLVYTVNPETGKAKDYLIHLPQVYVSQLVYRISPNEDIFYVGGTFKNTIDEKNVYKDVLGVFACSIDMANQKTSEITLKKFDKSFLAWENKKKEEKLDPGAGLHNQVHISNVFLHEDNSCTMLFEHYDPYGGPFKGIIVFNVAPEGKMQYFKTIKKWQVIGNHSSLFWSFYALNQGNGVSILYNGHPTNAVEQNKIYHRNSTLNHLYISNDGKTKTSTITDFPDEKYKLTPLYSSYSDDVFIISSFMKENSTHNPSYKPAIIRVKK